MSYIFITPFYFRLGSKATHLSPFDKRQKTNKYIEYLSFGDFILQSYLSNFLFFIGWHDDILPWQNGKLRTKKLHSSQRIHEKLLFEFSEFPCFSHLRTELHDDDDLYSIPFQ